MSINTPLGDTLEGFLENLLKGRSAIGLWGPRGESTSSAPAVGVAGSLCEYDPLSAAFALHKHLPPGMAQRMFKIVKYSAWSTKLSVLLAASAFLDADLFSRTVDSERICAIVTGHNINQLYTQHNLGLFTADPDDFGIDAGVAIKNYDSDHPGCIADVLGILGPLYLVGGACASGNIGLRCALDEIRHHEVDIALVVGPVFDFTPFTMHCLASIGALSSPARGDDPSKASRPFDTGRKGFVLSHGGAALVVEELGHALERGARIYAEVLGVEVISSASRMPTPSEEHEARVMERLLHRAGIDRQEVDFISAHATSTLLGDLAEIRAIRRAFGDHAGKLKINAPKSMLGHTIWSAAVVETVACVLQMRSGWLHPSINIDRLDPEIDLDVCANNTIEYPINCLLNNSFGFAGINSASLIRRYES